MFFYLQFVSERLRNTIEFMCLQEENAEEAVIDQDVLTELSRHGMGSDTPSIPVDFDGQAADQLLYKYEKAFFLASLYKHVQSHGRSFF